MSRTFDAIVVGARERDDRRPLAMTLHFRC
jgi:hypothetical protein